MTTWAYDFNRGELCADTQVTTYGRAQLRMRKAVSKNGVFAVASGTAEPAAAFLEWFLQGMPVDKLPDFGSTEPERPGCDAWVFPPDRPVGLSFGPNGTMVVDLVGGRYAEGSGGALALGAMEAGASPELALQIAAFYDVSTSGPFTKLAR